MTAAAAAALLGGVADTSSFETPDEGVDESMFSSAAGGPDGSVMDMDNDRCTFDPNDNQLDVAMLAANTNGTLQRNHIHHRPVLDFTPFLASQKDC